MWLQKLFTCYNHHVELVI